MEGLVVGDDTQVGPDTRGQGREGQCNCLVSEIQGQTKTWPVLFFGVKEALKVDLQIKVG